MSTGLRILPSPPARFSPELLAGYADLPVAVIGDSLGRPYASCPNLRPMHRDGKLIGPALTVRCRPGDNLLVHKAVSLARPGEVVVVDAGGLLENAMVGEIVVSQARANGVAGLVIHGAIRDSQALAKLDFPVFAAGVSHRGPYRDGQGEINTPIALGGMLVAPGDLIVGDADGVVCVPAAEAETIRAAAALREAAETATLEEIRQGTRDLSWIDAALAKYGYAPD